MDQRAWNERTRRLPEESYLQARTGPEGSGCRHDASGWERRRRSLVEAFHPTNQPDDGLPVGEDAHDVGAPADLPVQAFLRCSPNNTNEWQVCHRYMGTELLATARMTVVDGESEEPKEVIGELVAAG